jgi:hypothetical protein
MAPNKNCEIILVDLPVLVLTIIAAQLSIYDCIRLCNTNRYMRTYRLEISRNVRYILPIGRECIGSGLRTGQFIETVIYHNLNPKILLTMFVPLPVMPYFPAGSNQHYLDNIADQILRYGCQYSAIDYLKLMIECTEKRIAKYVSLHPFNNPTVQQFVEYIQLAIRARSLSTISYLCSKIDSIDNDTPLLLLGSTFVNGNLEILKYLLDFVKAQKSDVNKLWLYVYQLDVYTIEMLDYIIDRFSLTADDFKQVLIDNMYISNDDVVCYMFKKLNLGKDFAIELLSHGMIYRHIKTLRYVHETYRFRSADFTPHFDTFIIEFTYSKEMILFLFTEVCIDVDEFINRVSPCQYLEEGDDIHFLDFLFKNYFLKPTNILEISFIITCACSYGSTDIIRYLFEEIGVSFIDFCQSMNITPSDFLHDNCVIYSSCDGDNIFNYICAYTGINRHTHCISPNYEDSNDYW